VGGVDLEPLCVRRFAQRSGYRKTLCAPFLISYSKAVSRRAVLIFAEATHVELARRAFPNAARPLLNLPAFGPELPHGIDVHLFTSGPGSIPYGPRVHRQTGQDFAARLENAIERMNELGYDELVVVGRDCPSLGAIDIERAFGKLESRKLVLGPDHRGGCYLIAFHLRNRDLLRGVRWKRHTDCAQLRGRCLASEVCFLPLKHELDSWADIHLFARSGDPLAQLAAFLLRAICGLNIAVTHFVDLALQRVRVRQQMPPPALAI
jgi:hypothetical protein